MARSTDDTVPASALDDESAGDDELRRLLGDVARAPAQTPPPVAGERVGRYVLIRRLGAGGMGVVFAAYDPQLDRRVAIKLLRGDLVAATGSVRARERTLREARALARLIHPGIVAVHDAGFHKGELYIVMELVDGQSLREWLAERRRTWTELVDAFRQAAIGLAAAHQQQMVHRDFKPDNVLVGRDGRVRVADFGLVQIADAGGGSADVDERAGDSERSLPLVGVTPALTVTGAFMGTPAYMAPEQLDGGDVDARADQFAFGVSLWAALYGQPPWSVAELGPRRKAMAAGPPAEPATARAVPTWLRALVRRTLAPAAADRFPSMTAVVAALDRGLARGRRRATAVVAVAAAGLVGGALAIGATRSGAAPPCGGGPALVARAWGPGRAVVARARVLARGGDPALLDQLAPSLDTLAADWAREHRAACRATRVDRTQSERVLDLRMGCLDQVRSSLRATVDAIADGRLDEPARRAALHDLPAVAACADRETLEGLQPRPRAVDEAALDAAIDAMFEAKMAVYDVDRADPTLQSELALSAAHSTGWAPLVADAAMVHAELLRQRARYDQARPFYDEALREALRGSPIGAQAEIMAGLAFLEQRRDRPADAAVWIERALALVARLGRPADLELNVLDDAIAIAREAGDLRRARAFAERALTLARGPAGDRRRLAEAMLDLARVDSDDGRYQQAVDTIEQALALGREELGPDAPWQSLGLGWEVEPLVALGRTADARAAIQRAIALRAPVFGADDPVAVDLYASLGAVAQHHGDLAAARAAFAEALPRVRALHGADSTATAETMANLAMVDAEAGDHARAEATAAAATAIIEARLGPRSPDLINVLVLRGYAARGQGRLAASRQFLVRALDLAAAELGPTHPATANVEVELAHTDRLDGRRAAAIARYRPLTTRGDVPPPTLAEARFGLAQALWDDGDRAGAAVEAEQAAHGYGLLGADYDGRRAEVETWRAAHPAPR